MVNRQSIEAFISVIEMEKTKLSETDWKELQQMAIDLPEDEEEIANIIEGWLESEGRQTLLDSYDNQLEISKEKKSPQETDEIMTLGPFRSKPKDRDGQNKTGKQMIINSIQRNSPPSIQSSAKEKEGDHQ
jgi:hypothetical protein